MRRHSIGIQALAAALCAGLLTGAASLAATAAETPAGHLVVPGATAVERAGQAPVILRGSAVKPKAPPRLREQSAARWQITAGRRLWLIDPVTKDVVSCGFRNTSTVGVNEVRCTRGTAGRFHRTFGPNFQP